MHGFKDTINRHCPLRQQPRPGSCRSWQFFQATRTSITTVNAVVHL
jgi:hypothetical protein